MPEDKDPQTTRLADDDRSGLSIWSLKRSFLENLFYTQGTFQSIASPTDLYMALAYTVRDRLLTRWTHTVYSYLEETARLVGYLSMEFLPGPHLLNNLVNLGIYSPMEQAMSEMGMDLKKVIGQEHEPGLGNGGLGRLASCFMDSLATLDIPAIGYGIRYEYGIFNQEIRDGYQVERADKWLASGNPWEFARPAAAVEVNFGGHTEHYTDSNGRDRARWVPARRVRGIPYDTPIPGYRTNTVGILRLWKAEPIESFDFAAFNKSDYLGAVQEKVISETISKVLYPNDASAPGKQLRLEQQLFFVSCSLQDVIRIQEHKGKPLDQLHNAFALQLNDTHPAIAVAEMMRLLIDEHGLEWERAWEITSNTFSYTNHTLLPEALERWSVHLLARVAPRHLEIIYEINRRFLSEVRTKFPNDDALIQRISLIDESGERAVRMAHLATVGSHHVNGVAALHTELLKRHLLNDFYRMWPEKFTSVTNGVSPRRWLVLSNSRLSDLLLETIGSRWITNLDELRKLERFVDDAGFRQRWREMKLACKLDLASYIEETVGVKVDPQSMFDIQVKRIHEYKRQHLNVLHIITLYNRLKKNPDLNVPSRTFIFGGKAAPGYALAKLIVKLINSVADTVNNDPDIRGRLKVVFLPNYSVSVGQRVYPAAELSEQISTAGKEASGTGNMKFAMNGALTIGTLDGANVEIREEVGAENFFLFGLTADEVFALRNRGYDPREIYQNNPELRQAIDGLASGQFSRGDAYVFQPLIGSLLSRDEFFVLADYQPYVDCQQTVSEVYQDPERWTRMSILNSARMGRFSSDRSIRDYCEKIWRIGKLKVSLEREMNEVAR
jgi:glycogen phosphorylase